MNPYSFQAAEAATELLSEIDMLYISMVSFKILTSQFFIFFYFFGAYSFNALSVKFASVKDLPHSEQPSGSRRVAPRAASTCNIVLNILYFKNV